MNRRHFTHALLALPSLGALMPHRAAAETRAEIDASVAQAVQQLRAMEHTAPLFQRARAILVFPRIVQGGFIVGGQYGEGALIRGGRTEGYYSIAGASFGLLAGVQRAGLAMFFMSEDAIRALMNADGWEIGTGPSVVALDRGLQANITATTLVESVYAISFDQAGLMAALALTGTKISRVQR